MGADGPSTSERASGPGRARGDPGSHARTPLASGVLERGNREAEVPFHMPGHQRGRNIHPVMQQVRPI